MKNRIAVTMLGLLVMAGGVSAQAPAPSDPARSDSINARPALSTGVIDGQAQAGAPVASPDKAGQANRSANNPAPPSPAVNAKPLLAPLAVVTSEQTPLSIDKAIAIGLQYNRGIKIAEEAYWRASGGVRVARGARNPTLGIGGTYQRFDKVESAEIAPGQSIKLGEIDSQKARATLGIPIDVAGVLGASISTSEYQQKVALLEYEAQRQTLALNVRRTYLAVLQAREQERVALDSVTSYREQFRLANVRFEAGSAPKFDVLRAQTDLANAEQQLISAQNTSRLAAALLANVLGVLLQSPLVMTNPIETDKTLGNIEDLVQEGLKKRPEVVANEAAIQAAQKGIKVARRSQLPSLNLELNYNYNGSTTLFQPRQFTSDALVTVSLPIFDGGVAKGAVEQAKATLGTAQAQQDQTQLQVRLEIEQAVVSIENAKKRLSTALTTLDQAREALRLSQVRYESGIGIPLEVTDAEVASTQAQTNVVNARYDVLLAYANLARATGEQSYAAN